MALQKTVKTVHGLTATNAYHRIENMTLNKSEMRFDLRSYSDVNAPPFGFVHCFCAYNLNGENPIRQAYLYLKTLPEWADAADV